jgi:hypothetical protein
VLDPSTAFEVDETTGPVSWNGVSTGLERSTLRPPPPRGANPSTMDRVTVVARRVVREKRPFAPLVAVAILGVAAGLWRAVSSEAGPAVTASQTFLAAPGPELDPLASEVLGLAAPQPASKEGEAVDVAAMILLPETTQALAEREPEAAPRVAPRRPAPPARPKPAASKDNEPDVGF